MRVWVEAWKNGKILKLYLHPDQEAYEALKDYLKNADFVVTFSDENGSGLVSRMYSFFIEIQKLLAGRHPVGGDDRKWIRNFEITETDITEIND